MIFSHRSRKPGLEPLPPSWNLLPWEPGRAVLRFCLWGRARGFFYPQPKIRSHREGCCWNSLTTWAIVLWLWVIVYFFWKVCVIVYLYFTFILPCVLGILSILDRLVPGRPLPYIWILAMIRSRLVTSVFLTHVTSNVAAHAWSTKYRLITCISAQIKSNLRDESIKPN
jgi:hypothetical protein